MCNDFDNRVKVFIIFKIRNTHQNSSYKEKKYKLVYYLENKLYFEIVNIYFTMIGKRDRKKRWEKWKIQYKSDEIEKKSGRFIINEIYKTITEYMCIYILPVATLLYINKY